MKKSKFLTVALLIFSLVLTSLTGCGGNTNTKTPEATPAVKAGNEAQASASPKAEVALSEIEKIIKEAEGMSLEELAAKAIEESKGKTFYGVGNSSRGKTAIPLFIDYLKTIDPSYTMEYEWQQPKNNKIFEQLSADSIKKTGTFS